MDTLIAIIIIAVAGFYVFNKVRKTVSGKGCGCGSDGCTNEKKEVETNQSCCKGGGDCACDD